jgi:hypothetical protein
MFAPVRESTGHLPYLRPSVNLRATFPICVNLRAAPHPRLSAAAAELGEAACCWSSSHRLSKRNPNPAHDLSGLIRLDRCPSASA